MTKKSLKPILHMLYETTAYFLFCANEFMIEPCKYKIYADVALNGFFMHRNCKY